MKPGILILGAGYTGSRAGALFEGHRVVETHRDRPVRVVLPDLSNVLALGGSQWRVLWCAPSVDGIEALGGFAARVVYLSTTGVYGDAHFVDDTTAPAPSTERTQARLAAERMVQAGPWSSCVLRPAAIYGPGRGAHESIRAGKWRIAGDGSAYTSRIHVDDLASIAAAALMSDITGAWPVADDEPSTNLEITQFCCNLLGVPLSPSADAAALDETRRADRRVDGRAIRRALGVALKYPSYKTGIPAAF